MRTRAELERMSKAQLKSLLMENKQRLGLSGYSCQLATRDEAVKILSALSADENEAKGLAVLLNGICRTGKRIDSAEEKVEVPSQTVVETKAETVEEKTNNTGEKKTMPSSLGEMIAHEIEPFFKATVNREQVVKIVEEKFEEADFLARGEVIAEIEALRSEMQKTQRVEYVIKNQSGKEYKLDGVVHREFWRMLALLQCRLSNGRRVPVMLCGGAGAFKTSIVEKVAEVLGADFEIFNCSDSMEKSDLFGFIDAHGKYSPSVLYRALQTKNPNGCVFLMDEGDAGNANAMLAMNTILANGFVTFPDGTHVKVPETFSVIITANTFGMGESRKFVGRNPMDFASLDRFVTVDFQYDHDFEMSICTGVNRTNVKNPYAPRQVPVAEIESFVAKVQQYRTRLDSLKIDFAITPRASLYGTALLGMSFTMGEIEKMVIFKGLNSDIVRKVKGC